MKPLWKVVSGRITGLAAACGEHKENLKWLRSCKFYFRWKVGWQVAGVHGGGMFSRSGGVRDGCSIGLKWA